MCPPNTVRTVMRGCREYGSQERERSVALKLFIIVVVHIAVLTGATVGYGMQIQSAADPHLALDPLQTYVEPGELCTLRVCVDDAVDSLSCFEVYLSFDSLLVSCVSAEEGQLYKDATDPTFFDWELVTPDTVTAVDCVLGYRTFVLAPGELVTLVFSALNHGICEVRITKVRLWDIDRIELAPTIGQSAEIIIGSSSGERPTIPGAMQLYNYPNPFNPTTQLVLFVESPLGLFDEQEITVSIYEPSGRKVRSLYHGKLPVGRNNVPWDGRNDAGTIVAAGIYFAIATTEWDMAKRKLVIIR